MATNSWTHFYSFLIRLSAPPLSISSILPSSECIKPPKRLQVNWNFLWQQPVPTVTECESRFLLAVFMILIKTVRLVILVTPLLGGAPGQSRPATARPNTAAPQNSKVRDKSWLKSQVRRRYGTSAVPEKTQPSQNAKQTLPKN